MRPVLIAVALLSIAQPPPAPDLVIHNARVFTAVDSQPWVEAVAITGDRIVRVGSDAEVGALAGPRTRLIDLAGRTVIPGLIDNHMHLLRAGTTWQYEVRWDGVDSRKQALDLLRARVASTRPGETPAVAA